MKKVLLGCFLFFALFIVVGAIATYLFVIRPAKALFEDLEAFANYEERIENQEAFDPPESLALTQEQVDIWIDVQSSVAEVFGGELGELGQLDQLDPSGQPDWQELWRSLKTLGRVLTRAVEARDAQVSTMNEHEISLEEYHWIRDQAVAALVPQVDQSRYADILGNSEGKEDVKLPTSDETAAQQGNPDFISNMRLLEPHSEDGLTYIQQSAFGFK